MGSDKPCVKEMNLQGVSDFQLFFGCFDEHLKILESAFNVTIAAHGETVTLSGNEKSVKLAEGVLRSLEAISRDGFEVTRQEFQTAIRSIHDEHDAGDIRDLLIGSSTIVTKKRKVYPKSPMQKHYVDAIAEKELTFGIGPAGTGKTYLAMAMAVSYLTSRKVSRIILARPAVEAGESLGFLPGDMYEKINPYLRPLYDALYDMLDVEQVNRLVEKGIIEIAPIAFMRGRTLNDSFIIMDEAQNSTCEQMKMFLTRLGFNTKTVVTGDVTQIDLPGGKLSGLVQIQDILKAIQGVEFVYFSHKDVVRCKLVRDIVEAYNRAGL
ncbi:PhoH family protein [bacterium]|nr:PhoH family protein [candidate division CSSED10-310 bacterium]